MNVLRILKASIDQSIENASVLLINNLILFYLTIVSFGIFAGFFIFGLAFSYFYIGPTNQIYLPVILIIIFLGYLSAMLFLFPGIGTYLNFIYQTIVIKRRYNLMEELEYFDKNLLRYIIGGFLEYGPTIFLSLIFFVIWIIFQKNIFLLVFLLLVLWITSIIYFTFSFMTYPAMIIEESGAIAAFTKSIKIGKKYLIQGIISLLILSFVKFFGFLLLFFYPLFLYFIYMPIYGYFILYYYRAVYK